MRFHRSLLAAATVAAATLLAQPASANLVTNGDFEQGYTGWQTQGFGVSNWAAYAHSGNQSMATGCVGHYCVSGLGVGAYFSQTLATMAGAGYDLSFWVGETYGPTSELSVYWNGALIANILNPANNTLSGGSGMVQYSFSNLLATGASTSLEIHGRQDAAGICFDDVSVELHQGALLNVNANLNAVPEPASLALAGVALAGLIAARKRAWV